MQPRLTRSRTESIVAGVCGGLGEYFGVDPVIVRLVFVLVTVTSGLGLIVYPVLWLVMPRASMPPAGGPGYPPHGSQRQFGVGAQHAEDAQPTYVMQEAQMRGQPQVSSRTAVPPTYTEQPPPPDAYNFDPQTGQPLSPGQASEGYTIHLNSEQHQPMAPHYGPQSTPAPRPQRRGRWLAFILIGFGALILADSIGLNMDIIFPILMIAGGLLLLRRKTQ